MSWYYILNGEQFGPTTEEDIRHQISIGSIKTDDEVIGPGLEYWISASKLMEREYIPPSPPAHINDAGHIQCITCKSTQLHSGQRGFNFMKGGIFGSSEIIITCLKWGQQFRPGGLPY